MKRRYSQTEGQHCCLKCCKSKGIVSIQGKNPEKCLTSENDFGGGSKLWETCAEYQQTTNNVTDMRNALFSSQSKSWRERLLPVGMASLLSGICRLLGTTVTTSLFTSELLWNPFHGYSAIILLLGYCTLLHSGPFGCFQLQAECQGWKKCLKSTSEIISSSMHECVICGAGFGVCQLTQTTEVLTSWGWAYKKTTWKIHNTCYSTSTTCVMTNTTGITRQSHKNSWIIQ